MWHEPGLWTALYKEWLKTIISVCPRWMFCWQKMFVPSIGNIKISWWNIFLEKWYVFRKMYSNHRLDFSDILLWDLAVAVKDQDFCTCAAGESHLFDWMLTPYSSSEKQHTIPSPLATVHYMHDSLHLFPLTPDLLGSAVMCAAVCHNLTSLFLMALWSEPSRGKQKWSEALHWTEQVTQSQSSLSASLLC